MKKEVYQKPEIRSEKIEIGVYGAYGDGPIPELQPFFGQCCA
jgi:hypothetical protein